MISTAHRRTEIGWYWPQRVVNGCFERITETRLRTRIRLHNGVRIGAGIETATDWGIVGC